MRITITINHRARYSADAQAVKRMSKAFNTIRSMLYYALDENTAKEQHFWRSLGNTECVICGKFRGQPSSDLDTLFCSEHCVVCGGIESALEVKGGDDI